MLNPVWPRILVRSSTFQAGMLFFGVGTAFAIGLFDMHGPVFFATMVLSLGLAGIVMMLATGRKIEYASFQNTSGVTVVSIARAGPDVKRFDEFVGSLATRITQAKTIGLTAP